MGIQLVSTAICQAQYLYVCFRYSKGTARGFTNRMFASLQSSPLYFLAVAAYAIRRWLTLLPGPHTLLFCYFPSPISQAAFFLQDKYMVAALRPYVGEVTPILNTSSGSMSPVLVCILCESLRASILRQWFGTRNLSLISSTGAQTPSSSMYDNLSPR